tara:strand:+ start:1172 stop:1555 length:384 start_codon:yes stop_codon:yes gene_type:complete
MSAMTMLSVGNKWYSYSGSTFGDVSVPATIQLVFIPNTGLKDSLMQVQPFFGPLISTSNNDGLGITIKLDDVEIFKQQRFQGNIRSNQVENEIQLFIPRQSKVEILSNNTTGNNTQTRGCTVLGYYL